MNLRAQVRHFDMCRCSVNEIAEYLNLHEWQVKEMLRDPVNKPKRKRSVVLWRAKDYRRQA